MKILDFGLAKVLQPTAAARGDSTLRTHDERFVGRAGRPDSGNGSVHESGTGKGPAGGQAQRHLGVRRGAVRNAVGPPGVPR